MCGAYWLRAPEADLSLLIEAPANPRCPACNGARTTPSRPRGIRGEILWVLGGATYRCAKCELRHARLGPIAIPLRPAEQEFKFRKILAALSIGALGWVVVALWILNRFHRWPF